MPQIKNIKYTYYHYGQGPYQDTHTGYFPEQSSYSSVEDMLQKTHPDYTNIRVISYDTD
jgi:hypothetical protein